MLFKCCVYSLLASQSDDSAQVFFLSGSTIKTVAYKGAYIKSTETVSVTPRQLNSNLYPFITPMPNADGPQAFFMTEPTPTPRITGTPD